MMDDLSGSMILALKALDGEVGRHERFWCEDSAGLFGKSTIDALVRRGLARRAKGRVYATDEGLRLAPTLALQSRWKTDTEMRHGRWCRAELRREGIPMREPEGRGWR